MTEVKGKNIDVMQIAFGIFRMICTSFVSTIGILIIILGGKITIGD